MKIYQCTVPLRTGSHNYPTLSAMRSVRAETREAAVAEFLRKAHNLCGKLSVNDVKVISGQTK